MITVYVLQSLKDGEFYKGFSSDFDRRIQEHNTGKVRSTRTRRPFILIYKEDVATTKEARKREKYFKSGPGIREIKELLKKKL